MTEQDYTDFILTLKEIQSKIAKPDLMKVGKNFRCISESAILDVINPILNAHYFDYNIEVIEHELQIKEAAGSKFGDKKFIFVATCKVKLTFTSSGEIIAFSEALGMGIDEGDKAMGKAYTYAVKYALLKKIRLQYADDPDAEQSKEITLPYQPMDSNALNKPAKEEKKKAAKNEPLATQKMLDYLNGLTIQCSMSYEAFKAEFGFYPNDKGLLMKDVRAAIETLKIRADENLPF